MEENKNNEKEFAGGIEFPNETPIETPESERIPTPVKPTETVGGVEFAKQEERKSEEEKKTLSKDDAIHTMAEDMGENATQKQGAVLQTILKQEREAREDKKRQQKNLVFAVMGVVLFAAAIAVFILTLQEEPTVEPPRTVVQESLVFAENHSRVDSTGALPLTLVQNIMQKIQQNDAPAGEVTNIYLTRSLPQGGVQTQNTNQFFTQIQSSIPSDLLSKLDNDFMLGVFSGAERQPFIVLRTLTPGSIFGFREWERNMLQDIGRIFSIEVRDPDLYVKDFADAQIYNKPARVLFDNENQFVLGYFFLNEDLVAITTDQTTLQEILQRLATEF
jgi:hypothetical protein